MRFLLDNDVDIGVATVLRRAGHQCWTAHQAGLAGPDAADDDDVSIYAHRKRAVVVTHDREFSRRRIENTYGKHVWLRCEQPDAVDVLRHHLVDVEAALEQHDEVVVSVRSDGIEIHTPRWA